MMIAIFGGAGFVGRPLAKRLLEEGHRVIIVDNLSVKPAADMPKGATFHEFDVKKPVIRFILNYEPDVIYWLQAKQGYGKNWKKYAEENILPVYNLFKQIELNGKCNLKKIILASSQAVYEPGLDRYESSPFLPPSVYGATKAQQECAFFYLCHQFHIKLVILRYSIVLGAGQSLQSAESGILRNWYRCYKAGKDSEIYGDGTQIRDFVHVDDVTSANIRSLLIDYSENMNIGGFKTSILDLFSLFRKITGCRSAHILNKGIRPGGEYSMTSKSMVAETLLRWHPVKGPELQIKDFVDFWEGKEFK